MPVHALESITHDDAVGRINKYFEVLRNGRPRYTGSRFETFAVGGDTVESNRITAADLIAVSMLSIHVPSIAALGIMEELDGDIEKHLTQIPAGLRLEDLTKEMFEEVLDDDSHADRIWQLLRRKRDLWGIGQTTASKILALKRPHLVPIYDSVIAKRVGIRNSGGQWRSWWNAFQGDEGLKFGQRLDAIRAASGQSHLSLLRVLDIVLWMDAPRRREDS